MSSDRKRVVVSRFVSLYIDVGGLDLGFIAAGFTLVFANDINADIGQTACRFRAALSV